MRDELLAYYESELTFLRQTAAQFAEKYPKIASRLLLEPDRCEDPHTERLLEAFAFLAARVHLKVDDGFPEITTALLDVIYPHFLRPIPSMSIVEFHLDPEQGKLSTGLTVPRGSMLYSKARFEGTACKFRTCYETTLWPLTVAEAQWMTPDRLQPAVKAPDAVGAIRILLRCLPDVSFDKLDMSALRFYLNGENSLTHTLYELIDNNCLRILLRAPGARPGQTPTPRRSFPGYRLLQEYFSFPEKFLFFEISGLEQAARDGFKDQLEIILLISRFERSDRKQFLEVGVSESTFRLNCSPIVNLFPLTAEPILLDQTRHEYPVIPDVRRRSAIEVFSVDSVICSNPGSREVVDFEPFYSYQHFARRGNKKTFWHAIRRAVNVQDDQHTDVFLTLVDISGRPADPSADTITVRCTCTNGTLPSRLPFGNEAGDYELEGVSTIRRIVSLRKPSATVRPPIGKETLWRLISHLSLNYLSLVDDGKEALQQILRLYNFSDATHLQSQIAGINSLASSRHFARISSEFGITSARGTRVQIQLDEEQFVGGGVYLFASVLERFLGMYTTMNSFVQLVASTAQRKEVMKEWPPRAGQSILI
jgi:type VI secretion system protein ImpG